MIGRIQGRLLEKIPPFILIDCNGVGYEIEVPMTTFYELPDIGNEITLLTHFIVREDAQLLFGFISDKERKTFKQLIKVNGIGAKVALSILSGSRFQVNVTCFKSAAPDITGDVTSSCVRTFTVTSGPSSPSWSKEAISYLKSLSYIRS